MNERTEQGATPLGRPTVTEIATDADFPRSCFGAPNRIFGWMNNHVDQLRHDHRAPDDLSPCDLLKQANSFCQTRLGRNAGV